MTLLVFNEIVVKFAMVSQIMPAVTPCFKPKPKEKCSNVFVLIDTFCFYLAKLLFLL
jgi:hypothetical protein